ncbi:prepilin peptidase [Falsarthrobacter nasiphocae]|uniref:Prepilin signal peptidase PulO-like enzyme (Type II secretory pathway) n=1 Tax=Falsarthrobacter nasiphocae TaxID=189863 RepID=A0AAE3YGR1_9MICC|nr:prepilin peptidase [Falsarthrobacter nasiphocae]MDR6891643.1 prepilin signal peptidase PulO-like enzyme (type II secretory pathway) [Falsarthrobacter nasiphocae]
MPLFLAPPFWGRLLHALPGSLASGGSLPAFSWPLGSLARRVLDEQSPWGSLGPAWAEHIADGVALAGWALVWGAWAVSGVMLSIIDARERRLPRPVIWGAARVLGLGLVLVVAGTGDPWPLLGGALGAILAGGGLALARRAAALGAGDVRYAGFLGAVLGPDGLGHVVAGLACAFAGAGFRAAWLVFVRRAPPGTRLALGPYLFAGSAFPLVLLP